MKAKAKNQSSNQASTEIDLYGDFQGKLSFIFRFVNIIINLSISESPNIQNNNYRRNNKNLHVRGYLEEGTITTPFDMRVQNKIDRYNLVISAFKYLRGYGERGNSLVRLCNNKLEQHKNYIREYGTDIPDVKNWKWK